MAKTQIIWTILPYGMKDNRQRVSVVVSPRLTPERKQEEVLGAFPEFINWPEIIKGAEFSAEINGSIIAMEQISDIDDKLWSYLFNEKTFVEGFQYNDMRNVKFRSYSIRNILQNLKEYYAKLAVYSPSELPLLLPWSEFTERSPNYLHEMLEEAGTKTIMAKGTMEPGFERFFDKDFKEDLAVFKSDFEYNLYQADRFYRRVRPTEEELKMRRPDFNSDNIPDPPQAPEFDFHSIISALADYPTLMRRLGLVIDFVLANPVPIQSGELRLQINWHNQHNSSVDVMPRTAFLAKEKLFITSPRTSELKDGMLNLNDSNDRFENSSTRQFDVYQVDPDGAALKTVNFTLTAQSLVRKHQFSTKNKKFGEGTYTTGDQQGLAALRSGGIGVSQHNRAEHIEKDIDTMNYNNDNLSGNGNNITLYAEDVLLGYRVDVLDTSDGQSSGTWRSLCSRVGNYTLTESGDKIDLPPEDEGYVFGASTTSEDPDSNEHYLHESLFRWTGWSLCTPRPGLVLKAEEAEDGHIQSEVPCKIEDVAENGCGVKAVFTTRKGSLPRLRFGHLYRIRARVVDVAGNSLDKDDPSLDELTGASDVVGYWRFEPIDPPVVVHRTRVSEGESLERMVIRSNYDVSAAEYLDDEPFKIAIQLPDSQDFSYSPVNERHFVPPKSSQQQCETHGLFDKYFGSFDNILKGYEIAAEREAGTLYDGLLDNADCPVKLITPSALKNIATTKEGKPGLPDERNPVGDRMAGGQYIIHGEAQITTPWLPDGAARGIAIRAAKGYELPGVTEDLCNLMEGDFHISKINDELVILVYNRNSWPDSTGFRLILAERKAEFDSSTYTEIFPDKGMPKWNEYERTLTLFVPKGQIVRLVYASFANKDYIKTFGIPQWVQHDTERGRVKDSALCGANWLITPFRNLTLVHATQAPVFEPKFSSLILERELGSHDVKLIASDYDKEVLDYKGISLHGPSAGKFEVEATWREWVDDITKPKPERVEFKGQLGEIRLAENHRNKFGLKQAVDAQLLDPNAQRGDVHALGDTRFRLIEYRLRATTRFREYLPPSIYADSKLVTRTGPVATGETIWLPPEDDPGAPILRGYMAAYMTGLSLSNEQSLVPASAPPNDPRVLYIVPTMRWQTNQQTDEHDVTRNGNGLRVWLDRPWFSSGDGELLGVVICDKPFKDIDSALQPFVTQWGRDPFWVSPLPNMQVTANDFTAKVDSERLHLQENSSQGIVIVGHRVHWHDDRRLWYCDIELDQLKTYMPFVRLALVRYQPNAINNAKISKVVLTDFAQVLPRRRATVKIEKNIITAALYGPCNAVGPMARLEDSLLINTHGPIIEPLKTLETSRNRVELVLQTRDLDVDSDLAWKDYGDPLFNKSIIPETDDNKPFWEATAQLPMQLRLPIQPRRLMIREFERYYKNASTKEIEERLVFADIIDLPNNSRPSK